MSIYSCRQNPFKLYSKDFYHFIENNEIITCPYGHTNKYSEKIHTKQYSNNFSDNDYYDGSSSQDKLFIEKLKIGDLIIIPFEKTNKCMIKKILSESKVKTFTDIFDLRNMDSKTLKIKLEKNITENERQDINLIIEPKKMYFRDCENIGVFEYEFDARKFPRNSLSKIKNDTIIDFVARKCQNII